MVIILRKILVLSFALLVSACQTTDGTMRDQGHNEVYVQGFHDGRHSGMKEAGNNWEHYIRDHERFDSDTEYKAGWMAGEIEGKHLQEQAQSIGEAAGGAYTGYRISEEADKAKPHPHDIAKDAMKGVDTKELEALGK